MRVPRHVAEAGDLHVHIQMQQYQAMGMPQHTAADPKTGRAAY